MNRVFVVNRGGHDYRAAERFGTLVYCTDGELPRYNTSQMFRQIKHALEDSTPEDYILLTSLTTLNVVACSYFAHRHGRLNLLLFHAKHGRSKDGEYLERVVTFNQGDKDGEA